MEYVHNASILFLSKITLDLGTTGTQTNSLCYKSFRIAKNLQFFSMYDRIPKGRIEIHFDS